MPWGTSCGCETVLQRQSDLFKIGANICLGTTAAQSVFGKNIKISDVRGRALVSSLAPLVFVTTHPSSILRAPDQATRHQARAALAEDFRKVAALLRERGSR